MNANLFRIRCNARLQRMARSIVNLQKKHVAAIYAVDKILGQQRELPARLAHLQHQVPRA